MDFFQAQDHARARTRTLVLLFCLAVVAIILAVYVAVYAALSHAGTGFVDGPGGEGGLLRNRELFLVVAFATTMLIASGSIVRTLQLKGGGGARVAELLGAERVAPNSDDEAERRLINVVEEMALASGTPVPAIYLLNDDGINAFAAGYTTADAAVAMTRGAINTLTRDELQGVIAHEFSHILNGDMRLNIRLMGVLYGILLLATIGRGILRGSSRRGGRKGGGAQTALLGLALVIIGYVGVFFGRLIQAAASRQREYLADASAVQFTRNPGGIAGALKKIATHGSVIDNHHAQEASHLFFASGVSTSGTSLLASHPPLADRIRRIDRTFTGDLPSAAHATAPSPAWQEAGISRLDASVSGAALMGSIGTPQPEHVAYASQLLRSLPDDVHAASHDPDGAPALLFALLMHDGAGAAAQRDALVAHGGEELAGRVATLAKEVATLGAAARLPLLDLLQPALQQVAPEQRPRIQRTAQALVAADRRTDVFEFSLLALVRRRLQPQPVTRKATSTVAAPRAARTPESLRDDFQSVLSSVAWSGTDDAAAATRAYMAGVAALPRTFKGITLQPRDAISAETLDAALTRLRVATPGVRRTLVEACVHGVAAADGCVHMQEAELLRAIAEAVDCPMPPVTVTAVEQVRQETGAPA